MSELLHIIVRGRVQGVGYRYFIRDAAQRLGISGWVRNLPGGEVEVLARLKPASRGRFLAALQQGPTMSQVSDLEITEPPSGTVFPDQDFNIRQ